LALIDLKKKPNTAPEFPLNCHIYSTVAVNEQKKKVTLFYTLKKDSIRKTGVQGRVLVKLSTKHTKNLIIL
jgi:hypothetical protein